MPGRTRGKMFDIRPEHGVEDTGSGSYPGYPGYGESDVEPYGEYEEHYVEQDARRGYAPPSPRGGAPRNGRPPGRGAPAASGAPTTAVPAVRPADTGRTPNGRRPGVAADSRWDDEEPPLLSHRAGADEPAYARDQTPQGFDEGDPDAPGWGRRPAGPDQSNHSDDPADSEYDEDDSEYDDEYGVGDAPLSVPPPGSGGRPLGPADVEELDPSMTDALARVDLGAVQVPVPYGAELKLEPADAERPQAVHLLLPEGRIAVSALAAPRSSGLWPDLAAEIEQSLRKGGARVRNARGDWGRELHARTENAASVFVGCDGPRWMVYGVATASLETVEALDVELRRVLRGIIVVRGKSPYPPRTVLPLELPERLRREQAEVAPQKPSITVSVPRPAEETGTTGGPPADTGANARPASATGVNARPGPATGANRRPAAASAGASNGVPAGPPTGANRAPDAPARRAPEVPPARRDADADPDTRALPSVPRRPAAGPAPAEAERTARPAADSRRDDTPRRRPERRDRGADGRRGAAATGGRPAVDRPAAPVSRTPEPPRAPEPRYAAASGPADAYDVEPPVRRDPAVNALSAPDLLAAGPDERDRSAPFEESGRAAGRPGSRATGSRSGPVSRDPDAGAVAGDRSGDVLGDGRRSRRRRGDDADGRVDAADLLAGRSATEPARDPDPEPAPARAGFTAIEDIPLSDIPLMEATLDRLPEPEPEPAPEPEPLPQRTRRRSARDAGEDEWLSSEIAASRRAGRHGSGTSVADLLASAALDDDGGGRRRSEQSGPRQPEQDDGDLFATSSYLDDGPASADEARSALQDLLRSASAGSGDDSGVTGPTDYRTGRDAASRRNGRGAARAGRHGGYGADDRAGSADDDRADDHGADDHGAGDRRAGDTRANGRRANGYGRNGYRANGHGSGGYGSEDHGSGDDGTAGADGYGSRYRDADRHRTRGRAGDRYGSDRDGTEGYGSDGDGSEGYGSDRYGFEEDETPGYGTRRYDSREHRSGEYGADRHGSDSYGADDPEPEGRISRGRRGGRRRSAARSGGYDPYADRDDPPAEPRRAAGGSGVTGPWPSGGSAEDTDLDELGRHRRD